MGQGGCRGRAGWCSGGAGVVQGWCRDEATVCTCTVRWQQARALTGGRATCMGRKPILVESFTQWIGLVNFFRTVLFGPEAEALFFSCFFPSWFEKAFVRVVYAVTWPHVLFHKTFCWFCGRVPRALYYSVLFLKWAMERLCLSRLCSGLATCTLS